MNNTYKAIILLAVGCLGLASCTQNQGSTGTNTQTLSNVVFIDIDSLYENYTLYIDNKSVLEEDYNKAEKSIAAKLEGYQKKVADFQQRVYNTQQKANELSPVQMQSLQRRFEKEQNTLAAEEQELVQKRDVAASELQNKMITLQQDLKSKVDTYLETTATENGYDYILIKGGNGGGVIYGAQALDITAKTLQDLNGAYESDGDKLMESVSGSAE